MLRHMLTGILTSMVATSVPAASWDHYETFDQMRGTKTRGAMLSVGALDDPQTTLLVNVIDSSDKVQGVVFNLKGSERVDCPERICEIDVRFGDGPVHSQRMALDENGRTLIPTESTAFAASMAMVKDFFIELRVSRGIRKQFKFEAEAPAFPRLFTPYFEVAGISFGGRIDDLPASFKQVESGRSVQCREAQSVSGVVKGLSLPSVRICAFGGDFYIAFLNVRTRAEKAAVAEMLTAQLGSKDRDSYMETWPDSKGKLIDPSTVVATFWPDPKAKEAGGFMVMDKAIADLVPK